MKIITIVGTSLISNSNVDGSDLEGLAFSESLFDGEINDNAKKRIFKISEELFKFCNEKSASAELSSLLKIDPLEKAEVYLLCTETILSYLCGKVIKKYLGERAKVWYVKGLQVKSLDDFKRQGVPNLLYTIENIAQGGNYWDDLVLNVTGGYKAVIPIMTIIGQVKRLTTYYLFKGEDDQKFELLEMPKMPVDYNLSIFETHWDTFSGFGEKGNGIIEKSELSHGFIMDCLDCIECVDELVSLNPLGKILCWSFRQQYFFLNAPVHIWEKIQQQDNIRRILETKFYDQKIRDSKTERKQDHLVYDDGKNVYRIFYFVQDEKIYVYKSFENEENAKAFISTPFNNSDKKKIVENSKSHRIQIKQ